MYKKILWLELEFNNLIINTDTPYECMKPDLLVITITTDWLQQTDSQKACENGYGYRGIKCISITVFENILGQSLKAGFNLAQTSLEKILLIKLCEKLRLRDSVMKFSCYILC